jgi:hypothetical protein
MDPDGDMCVGKQVYTHIQRHAMKAAIQYYTHINKLTHDIISSSSSITILHIAQRQYTTYGAARPHVGWERESLGRVRYCITFVRVSVEKRADPPEPQNPRKQCGTRMYTWCLCACAPMKRLIRLTTDLVSVRTCALRGACACACMRLCAPQYT